MSRIEADIKSSVDRQWAEFEAELSREYEKMLQDETLFAREVIS